MEEVVPESEFPSDFRTNQKLHRAARKGKIRALRKHCKSVAGPDAVNEQHQSPLFVAALHGREGAVKFLLRSGADPNHACYDGSTPMHAACLACSPRILCLLAEAGGNITHHDNRGLVPRDWVSYQEDIDKRFKMRKFLEVMRLYAIGTVGDETLSRTTRTRWNAFMQYVRQFPERRRRRWRRRRWFTPSSRHRFRPRVPHIVTAFFARFPNIACLRFFPRRPYEVEISQQDTLPSRQVMQTQLETAKTKDSVMVETNDELEIDGCKLQLSDSTYPVQTLYVDERQGKLASSKKKASSPPLPLGLDEIREESSRRSSQDSASGGGGTSLLEGKCLQETGRQLAEGRGVAVLRRIDGRPSPRSTEKSLSSNVGATAAGVKESEDGNLTSSSNGPAVLSNEDVKFVGNLQGLGVEQGGSAREGDVSGGVKEKEGFDDEVVQEKESGEKGKEGKDDDEDDGSSSCSADSCKNRMMEILEDAFKMELAPGVSQLMAEYCDSTQSSNAAAEHLDLDFHSYHGDDDVDIDEVKWIGEGEGTNSASSQEQATATYHFEDNPCHDAEREIDALLMNAALDDNNNEDEAVKNFIMEGRYIDVQKMLDANLETVFHQDEEPSSSSPNIDNNGMVGERQAARDDADVTDRSNMSSLYQVSALDEAAFISDLSLLVNVNESMKSPLESAPTQDDEDKDEKEAPIKPEGAVTWRDMAGDINSLHSALAKMDLTVQEKEEVQAWFGGHGSVRRLIANYETKIQEIECETLRSHVTSLGHLLRREYGLPEQEPKTDETDVRRRASDTDALFHPLHKGRKMSSDTSDVAHTRQDQSSSTPRMAVQATEGETMSYDESWLLPGNEDEDESFEQQLRRSMDHIDVDEDDDEGGRRRRTASGAGDALKECHGESPTMVSPPPPTCTPEDPSEEPGEEGVARVNHSGDFEATTAGSDQNNQLGTSPPQKGDSPSIGHAPSPGDSPGGRGLDAAVVGSLPEPNSSPSPKSREATRRLVAIDRLRSPTVEAIEISHK